MAGDGFGRFGTWVLKVAVASRGVHSPEGFSLNDERHSYFAGVVTLCFHRARVLHLHCAAG